MKTKAITAIMALLFLVSLTTAITPTFATLREPKFEPKGQRKGWIHWVWVEIEWIPSEGDWASADVYAYDRDENQPPGLGFPPGTERGTHIFGPFPWRDYSGFEYELIGKTMQFDVVNLNPSGIYYPEIQHVVLTDTDGDGVYTGSETTLFNIVGPPGPFPDHKFFEVDQYEVEIENGEIVRFYYEFHQYYKYIED